MTDEQQPLDLDPPVADDPPPLVTESDPAPAPAPAPEPTVEPTPTVEPGPDSGPPPAVDPAPVDTDHGPGGIHAAAHGPRRVGGTRADRNIVAFGLGMMLCAILIAVVPDFAPTPSSVSPDRLHARILIVVPVALAAPSATVTVLDGDRRGDVLTVTLEGPTGTTDVPDYAAGDEVLVAADAQPDGSFSYTVVDRWRLPILGWLLGGFALALIAIAGWTGLRTLTALAITLSVVVRLLIPLLLAGYDPVGLAVGLGIAITAITLLLTHGLSRSTGAAIAGTTGGLVVTAALAALVSGLAQFGVAQGSEQIAILGRSVGDSLDLSGLLLAAIILGGLGVLNDVALTQAVAVEEFSRHDPALKEGDLFRRAMSAGLSHLAASVNTLVLAYVGAALPVIVILALQVHRLDLTLNDEHVAVEVVRIFVGALGVLSAVPLTTAIAAIWVRRSEAARKRGPRRVMATRLAGPADRFGSLAWLARLRSSRRGPLTGPERAQTAAEPLGRRRSSRANAPGRPTRDGTVQTELPLIAADDPSSAETPIETSSGTGATKPADEPAPVTTPVPPTRPIVARKPRRRGPPA